MAGRLKRSPLSRTDQVREAQCKFREKMAESGLVSLQAYVPQRLKTRLDTEAHQQTKSRGERLTEILEIQYAGQRKARP